MYLIWSLSKQMPTPRLYNFAAGPATLPESVLHNCNEAVSEYKNTGMSILELNHRSPDFCELRDELKKNLRRLLSVPDNYDILFLQGGARQQFAMVGLNYADKKNPPAYVVSGHWGKCALDELSSAGIVYTELWNGSSGGFRQIPDKLALKGDPSYVHVTTNETIHAIQLPSDPAVYLNKLNPETAVIADASSDLTSRELPIEKYKLVYACAQKLCGIPGNTIVIIDKEFANRANENVQKVWSYRNLIQHDSLYNTSPVFPIFVSKLMTDWMLSEFGDLKNIEQFNKEKFSTLYETVKAHPDVFTFHADENAQSKMNVVITVKGDSTTNEGTRRSCKEKGFLSVSLATARWVEFGFQITRLSQKPLPRAYVSFYMITQRTTKIQACTDLQNRAISYFRYL